MKIEGKMELEQGRSYEEKIKSWNVLFYVCGIIAFLWTVYHIGYMNGAESKSVGYRFESTRFMSESVYGSN